ncbi:MAG: hypothetical protein AAGF77_04650 [Bacteroidota bacterium]
MNKRKVRAVTLSEMLVVLLITVIVVGLAFSVLNLVQKQMWEIRGNYDDKTELYQLQRTIFTDMNRYGQMYYSFEEDRLQLRNELEQVDYHFQGGMVLRDKDTFNVGLQNKSLYFGGYPLKASGKADALELHLELMEESLFFYKANAAEIFMN